jgi:hypothetical protein
MTRISISNLATCRKHLNKIIFQSEEIAFLFIEISLSGKNFQVYLCPVVKTHYHILDKTKANRKTHMRERRK